MCSTPCCGGRLSHTPAMSVSFLSLRQGLIMCPWGFQWTPGYLHLRNVPPHRALSSFKQVIYLPSVLRFLLLVFIYCTCTPARRSEDNCTLPLVVSFRCVASGCWAEDSVWFLGTVPVVSIFPTLVGVQSQQTLFPRHFKSKLDVS